MNEKIQTGFRNACTQKAPNTLALAYQQETTNFIAFFKFSFLPKMKLQICVWHTSLYGSSVFFKTI